MVEDSEKLINLWTNPLKSIALLPKNIKSSNANSKYFATFKIPPFSDGQNCLWRFTQRSFSIIIPCEIAGLKYSFFFPPIMFGSLPLWVRRVVHYVVGLIPSGIFIFEILLPNRKFLSFLPLFKPSRSRYGGTARVISGASSVRIVYYYFSRVASFQYNEILRDVIIIWRWRLTKNWVTF